VDELPEDVPTEKFPQIWISASEPYEISLEGFPYRDTWPFFKAVFQEFGAAQLIWGTGYPRPRWELPMEKELAFVDSALDFYTSEDRETATGQKCFAYLEISGSLGIEGTR